MTSQQIFSSRSTKEATDTLIEESKDINPSQKQQRKGVLKKQTVIAPNDENRNPH